jgi:hypothetical protein
MPTLGWITQQSDQQMPGSLSRGLLLGNPEGAAILSKVQ